MDANEDCCTAGSTLGYPCTPRTLPYSRARARGQVHADVDPVREQMWRGMRLLVPRPLPSLEFMFSLRSVAEVAQDYREQVKLDWACFAAWVNKTYPPEPPAVSNMFLAHA